MSTDTLPRNVIQLGDHWRIEFSTSEVGEMIGQTSETVRRQCVDGLWPGAVKRRRSWRIPASALLTRPTEPEGVS